MKQMFALFLAVCLLLSVPACAQEEEDTVLEFSAQEAGTQETPWAYPIAREILEDPDGVILLVNKENLLDKTYPPEETLVDISLRKTSSSNMQGRDIAVEALGRLFEGAEAAGYTLYVDSAYRSYRTQEVMHYNRVESMGYDDGYVQSAGASEHQTGMAFDVVNKEWADRKLNSEFANTQEAQWMASNCAQYGFIIRYPADKEEITGIAYEPWHLRYVGEEVAGYIMENSLTLEEFTEEYLRAIDMYEAGQVWGEPIELPQIETYEEETDSFVF